MHGLFHCFEADLQTPTPPPPNNLMSFCMHVWRHPAHIWHSPSVAHHPTPPRAGMADPAPVVQTFFVDDDIKGGTILDAVLTLVDARHCLQHLREERPEGVENETGAYVWRRVQQPGAVCAGMGWGATVGRLRLVPAAVCGQGATRAEGEGGVEWLRGRGREVCSGSCGCGCRSRRALGLRMHV